MLPPPSRTPRLLAAMALTALLTAGCGLFSSSGGRVERPIPVEVAPIERGPIALRRTFHASLEAESRIVVATMASGRIASIGVQIGDPVVRGQVVAILDRGEYAHAVQRADAGVAISRARLADAEVQAELSELELERIRALFAQGAVSQAELDQAFTRAGQRRAAVEVARAEIDQSRAGSATARVGMDVARIAADWPGDDPERVVAERFVDEGTVVSANTPLLSIVDMDPLRAVTWATERDYARLKPGQAAEILTDAWPEQTFEARVARVAPVFDAASRQARVELEIPNPEGHLKPGLFVRAEVVLDLEEDATIVPFDALVTRDGGAAVFVVDGAVAHQRVVQVGIREGDRVQVSGDGLTGSVVVLGQQLLHDGAAVNVVSTGRAGP